MQVLNEMRFGGKTLTAELVVGVKTQRFKGRQSADRLRNWAWGIQSVQGKQ